MLYGSFKYGQAAYSTADLEEGASTIASASAVTASGLVIKEGVIAIGHLNSVRGFNNFRRIKRLSIWFFSINWSLCHCVSVRHVCYWVKG